MHRQNKIDACVAEIWADRCPTCTTLLFVQWGYQVTSFAVEYSRNGEFDSNDTVRIDGKASYFLSDRLMGNGTTGNLYETDVTGLQVMPMLMGCI